jgi:hypothetical protein
MLPVSIGFVSAGLLLLTLGFLIRKGKTWLIAGYDPRLVRDEKGLANWFGSVLMTMAAIAILAGGLIAVVPEAYVAIPVIVFAVTIPAGVITLLSGVRKFVK